jgi:CheY-like chemotaxis protein
MLQAALERDGFELVTATSVSGALSRIAAEQFDVLLSDLHNVERQFKVTARLKWAEWDAAKRCLVEPSSS